MKILNLTADKYIHFIAGAGVCTLASFIFAKPMLGASIAIASGALKEWYDSRGHGCAEWQDFIATALGGTIQGIILAIAGGF